jgi:uncharacterized tellurite resistance protein B-like protein
MDSLEHISRKGKSYIKQLLQVAMADGHLDTFESSNLMRVAQRLGITDEEVLGIKNNIDKVTFNPPKGTKETFRLIFDLVWMMMVDGRVIDNEVRVCENLAMQMGFAPETVSDLAGFIRQNMAKGIPAEETYQQLEQMLS